MSETKYIIWHDRDYDLALWVYENTHLKGKSVRLRELPKKTTSESLLKILQSKEDFMILPVIKYETADIIIQRIDDKGISKILCVNELSTHVPQFEHPAQRFARLYGASQLKIPSALVIGKDIIKLEKVEPKTFKNTMSKEKFGVSYSKLSDAQRSKADKSFLSEKAIKERPYGPTNYTFSPVIAIAYNKTSKINKTPVFWFVWPSDGHSFLDKRTGKCVTTGFSKLHHHHPTSPKIEGDVKRWIAFINACIDGKSLDKIQEEHNEKIIKHYSERKNRTYKNIEEISKRPYAQGCVPHNEKTTTSIRGPFSLSSDKISFTIGKTKLTIDDPSSLNIWNKKAKCYVFAPDGLQSHKFRTDPYAGMLALYDNLFCRNDAGELTHNLIFMARDISLARFTKSGTLKDTKGHNYKKCPFENFTIAETLSYDEIKNHLEKENCPFTSSKQQRNYTQNADLIIFDDDKNFQGRDK